MQILLKFIKWLLGLAVLAAAILAGWLYFAPPELIRVGSGYAAKIVCSNVFIAGRDANDVLAVDVQAPGHPLLKLMRVSVDKEKGTVSAGLFGALGKSVAVAREGLGCASVPDGDIAAAKAIAGAPPTPTPLPDAMWPEGDDVGASQDPEVVKVLDDPAMTGAGMRAVVVVKRGRIVAERYGDGFSEKTPLLGWSMTKTVNAAIVGTLVKGGKLAMTNQGLFGPWKGDGRAMISLADMMAMSSGLEFNEDYGDVADVTRMLYLEPDMAGFAGSKPLTGEVGKVFSYSSGTAVMLSRLWQDAIRDKDKALAWPRAALFDPLGMHSAVLEADEHGTFVGSSYLMPRHGIGRASASSCCRAASGTAKRYCPPASSTGCGNRQLPRRSTARGNYGSKDRATKKTPVPALPPACPRTPIGWRGMTGKRSPSSPRSSWLWCGSA